MHEALHANQRVQEAVALQLSKLAERKAANRRKAAEIYRQLREKWDVEDATAERDRPSPESLTKFVVWQLCDRTKSDVSGSIYYKRRALAQKWKYDPNRKWTRRFFVDPIGTIPEPNDDTKKRRKLDAEEMLVHRCPVWSKKETNVLMKLVAAEKEKSTRTDTAARADAVHAHNDNFEDGIDFDQVADLLQKEMAAALCIPSSKLSLCA